MRYHVSVDEESYTVEVTETKNGASVKLNGVEIPVDVVLVNAPSVYSLLMENHSHDLIIEGSAGEYAVLFETELYHVKVRDDRTARLARVRAGAEGPGAGEIEVKAPMPGAVVSVEVEAGASVAKGQGLVVLQAMKMENEIRSPRPGVVKRVAVSAGQTVTQGEVLAVIGQAEPVE